VVEYQHDGAPLHYVRRVRNLTNEKFHGRWVSGGEPIHWTTRSPDVKPFNFLWGHVYLVLPFGPADRLHAAVGTVNYGMLQNVRESIVRRVNKCVAVGAGLIEHIL
jgi:hypothetical protein